MRNLLIMLVLTASLQAHIFSWLTDITVDPEVRQRAIDRGTQLAPVRVATEIQNGELKEYKIYPTPRSAYYQQPLPKRKHVSWINTTNDIEDWYRYLDEITKKHEASK